MQDEVKQYDPEDWEKAVYIVSHGFVKRNYANEYEDIRECAINIYNAKCKTDEHPFDRKSGWEEYTKRQLEPGFK
jgi:hypothetical protein